MALEPRLVQVQIGGTEQKSGSLVRRPGSLDVAENVVFDKMGDGVVMSKRRGYRYVSPEDVVARFDADALLMHACTLRGELVVITHDYVAALGSQESALRGEDALVYRGPCNRGNVRLIHVSTSQIATRGDDTA